MIFLVAFDIAFVLLQEPLGGAHSDPYWTSQQIKTAILESMDVSDRLFSFCFLTAVVRKYNHILITMSLGTWKNGYRRVVKAQDAEV